MINLTHVINIVTKELMGTIKAVSRVREALGDTPNPAAKKPAAPAAAGPNATGDAAGAASPTPAAAGSTKAAVVGAPVVEGEGAGQVAGEGGGAEGAGLLPVTQASGEKAFNFCWFGEMLGYRFGRGLVSCLGRLRTAWSSFWSAWEPEGARFPCVDAIGVCKRVNVVHRRRGVLWGGVTVASAPLSQAGLANTTVKTYPTHTQ